jgi:transcriptional regulator, XRE family
MVDFGTKLKLLRRDKKISQFQLSKILFVSESTIGMYETNKIRPSHEILLAIAEYFDVSLDELYGRY